MFARHERQRHSRAAIFDSLLAIDVQTSSTDLTTLKFCPPHARPNALHYQRPFQFCNRRYDHDDCPSQWSLGVYGFALAEELNPKSVQFVQHLQKVLS